MTKTERRVFGYSPLARYLVPVLPLLIPLLATGARLLSKNRGRWIVYALAAWAAMMTVLLLIEPMRLWTDAEKGMSLASSAPVVYRLFPSFLPPGIPPLQASAAIAFLVGLAGALFIYGRAAITENFGEPS